MQPTPRTLALLLVAAVLVALSGLGRAFSALAGAWLALGLGLLLADWRLTPRAGAWDLMRSHEERLSLAAWNPVRVSLRLRRGAIPGRASLRPAAVWLRDDPPAAFAVSGPRIMTGRAAPGEETVLEYRVRPPRRGDFIFGDLYLRWESTLGLFRRQARYPASHPVKVYPNLADVKKYDLLVRNNRLWELGLRHSRLYGSGSEYERLRDYLPDDDYRRINWPATARRGKPISVEFETERSQNLMAMLDIGRMMRSPVGDVAKLDYAINAVLLLAYVATQRGDRVGLLTFADRTQSWLAPRGGKTQFHRMLELLYGVEAQPLEPDYGAAFGYLASRQHKRSLVLVFTDLTGSVSMDSLVAQMVRLRRQHLPMLVTIADPGVQALAEQRVTGSRSLYERTVAEQLLAERKLALDRLRSQGILTLDIPADGLTVAVIDRYLELKARQRI